MADQLSLSAIARLLKPIFGAVSTRVRRLHAERQAGVEPFGQQMDLPEKVLNNTLNRLRGGNIDDAWWRSRLDSIVQQFITPELLKQTAVQEWLGEGETADDLKVLAKGRILGGRPKSVQKFANALPKVIQDERAKPPQSSGRSVLML